MMTSVPLTVPPSPDTWLNVTETAQILGIKTATLYRWIKKDMGPPLTTTESGRFRYKLGDVITYRDHHGMGPRAPRQIILAAASEQETPQP